MHLQARSELATELVAGDQVRISRGEFSEFDAIFMTKDGDERVILMLDLLSRKQQVTIPLSDIVACPRF